MTLPDPKLLTGCARASHDRRANHKAVADHVTERESQDAFPAGSRGGSTPARNMIGDCRLFREIHRLEERLIARITFQLLEERIFPNDLQIFIPRPASPL